MSHNNSRRVEEERTALSKSQEELIAQTQRVFSSRMALAVSFRREEKFRSDFLRVTPDFDCETLDTLAKVCKRSVMLGQRVAKFAVGSGAILIIAVTVLEGVGGQSGWSKRARKRPQHPQIPDYSRTSGNLRLDAAVHQGAGEGLRNPQGDCGPTCLVDHRLRQGAFPARSREPLRSSGRFCIRESTML